MSHRNKHVLVLLLFLFAAPFPAYTQDQEKNIFIGFYQNHISPIDGHRCPMYPSCSTYASMAIKKHGPVIGWIMACDRLIRCGRDETRLSLQVLIKNKKYTYDPVSANDDWWFKKIKTDE